MSDFINTIDALGDDAVMDSLIERSITEFKDDKLTSVPPYAFACCESLTNVEFPNLTTIGTYAFHNTAIEYFDFTGVTSIGNFAFDSCRNLKSFNIPASMTEIAGHLFSNCPSLISVDLPHVTKINYGAFQGCSSLESVNIPLVSFLGDSMFAETGITIINLPLVNMLYANSFRGCPNLRFVDCGSIVEIAINNFLNSSNFEALIIRTGSVCKLAGTNAFSNTKIASGKGYIYVPRALISDYKVASNWSTYVNQFRAIEDYSVDGTTTGEIRKYCESISLDKTELTFTDAQSITLTPICELGILDTISWSSSDMLVALVDQNGVVTPRHDGTAVITVTCGDNRATCSVTVNAGLEGIDILYGIGFNSGYLNGSNGGSASATSDLYTDKFNISAFANSAITVQLANVTTSPGNSRICYYNSNNAFISATGGSTSSNGAVIINSTVPSNAVYAAISIAKNNNFSINIISYGKTIGIIDYTS